MLFRSRLSCEFRNSQHMTFTFGLARFLAGSSLLRNAIGVTVIPNVTERMDGLIIINYNVIMNR